MSRAIVFCLVLAVVACGDARGLRAGLVQIDDFSVGGAPLTLQVNGFDVTRTVTGGTYRSNSQSWSLDGPGTLTVQYAVTGGSFSDLVGGGFSGFLLNINRNGTGSTTATAATNLGQSSGPVAIATPSVRVDYEFSGFDGSASIVTFTFNQTGRPGAKFNLNTFSAVPEPSALLLVVSALAVGLVRRRRI